MEDAFVRERMLFGPEGLDRLSRCRVAVFGLGALDLVDPDSYAPSNLNRQLHATVETLGKLKTQVARDRILSINPGCRVTVHPFFYLPETASRIDLSVFDYILDAVDTVKAKLALAENARSAGVPIISAMGTGNKINPSALKVSDIEQTSVCPLARIMRTECRKRNIQHLKVVWSDETPMVPRFRPESSKTAADNLPRRDTPGSTAFVPAAAGLLMAAEAVQDLLRDQPGN